MDITFGTHLVEALVFGLVVAAVEILIGGAPSPWPVRSWLARTWVYMCFCWIILWGLIKV